ncbi:MAG: SPASM domain-containing protein [Mesorhizobium sp.]|nr:SPASM domain-containing protein [Mesorhizobium sp.]
MALDIKQCHWPWFEAFVHVNGDVKPCCYATGRVGTLSEESLQDIWLGAAMEEVRDYVANNAIHPVCSGASCAYIRDRVSDEVSTDPEARLKAMADSGSPFGNAAWGLSLIGKGDLVGGLSYLRAASRLGNANGQYHLGKMLSEQPDGDKAEALDNLEKAAAQKYTPALMALGVSLVTGSLGVRDAERARTLFKEAGERGDPAGFYRLSEIHRHGEAADTKEADRFLKLAANRGHAGAREMLGMNA